MVDVSKPKNNGTKNNDIPSGFPAMKFKMLALFVFMFVVYNLMSKLYYPYIESFLNMPRAKKEMCGNDIENCHRGDLFAFQMISWILFTWSGVVGFYVWHIKDIHKKFRTPESRLFGFIPEAQQLTAAATTYQMFDFIMSLFITEHCELIFLCHHLMAATVSWYGLNNQYFHYYGVFYLGCSEISSIPLVVIDLVKYFPPNEDNPLHTVNGICGPLFLIAFIVYRIVLWWKVSFQMFSDVHYALRNGIANKLRPGRNHIIYVMITINILLGCLQIYWLVLILKEAVKVLGIESSIVKNNEM